MGRNESQWSAGQNVRRQSRWYNCFTRPTVTYTQPTSTDSQHQQTWLSDSTLVSINKLLHTGLVSTGMGDHLRAGKPAWLITSHSGQLSLLPSAGRKTEYRPKCGDALRLGSKGRYGSLYFTWSIAEAKCSGHSHLCVCLPLAAFSHYCQGVPSSCALLGGFAVGARVLLLWQHACV